MRSRLFLSCLVFSVVFFLSPLSSAGTVTGELKVWHKVTITFDGPDTNEQATPNPFMDYRLNVTFTGPSNQVYVVPGYYAADGDAANTSADSGNKWRVHLAPDEVGLWTYAVSFRSGTDVAVSDDPTAGSSGGFMDGQTGSFTVEPTDKTGRDFRGKGRLQYVGKHHLQFAETGEYFLKCGADAPENFLAYEDFDGDFKTDGNRDDLVKSWSFHTADWQPGDPTWASLDGVSGTYGKAMIGAINYLQSEGMNVFSFLPMNINGDDKNVFPYTTYSERYRIDVSKVSQWEIVFEHGTKLGMYLHFKTQETENELLLDGGNMGPQRTLYYRELIARFSHHLALNWNLGEEINNATTAQKAAWAQYFYDHDPYHHHIVIHNGANHYDLLGPNYKLTGFSLQTNNSAFVNVHSRTLDYITRSDDAGKPWVVACDEPGDASHALLPDSDDPDGINRDDARKNALWGNIMAGGAGVEWYFGYQHPHSDLTCNDWRSRDMAWDQCRYALDFFKSNNIPFWEMVNDDALTTSADDYCFYKDGQIYLVYLKNGGTTDITVAAGDYAIRWFNPRAGGSLQTGTTLSVSGPGTVSIGSPLSDTGLDWLAVLTAGPVLRADFDSDGDVDIDDFTTLAADWLSCNNPTDPECDQVMLADALLTVSEAIEPLAVTTDGLVHYWPLDDNTGNTAVDSVGGNDGSIGAGVTLQSGKVGNALHFDGGTDAHVTVPNVSTEGLKSMTISFWMNPDTNFVATANYKRIISGGDNWEAVMQPDTGVFGNNFYQSGSSYTKSTAAPVEGEWTHVAMTSSLGTTASPGTMAIYINGQMNNSEDWADDDWGPGTILFGFRSGVSTNQHYKGLLDDIRIYDRILSDSAIEEIYLGNANMSPQVNAGDDQEMILDNGSASFQLAGTVSDDGNPEPPSLTYGWSVIDKPVGAMVNFIPDTGAEAPFVTVDRPGDYILRLTADDGEYQSFDEVTLTAVELSCQYIIEMNLQIKTDISGPQDVPDCYVNLYDFARLAAEWWL